MKNFILIAIFFLLTSHTYSQNWKQLLMNGETDFRTIQKAFYEEWGDKKSKRGDGYKQFKRWEHLMSSRLDKNGHLTNLGKTYVDSRARAVANQIKSKNTTPWTPLGPTSWINGPEGYNPGLSRINSIAVDPNDPNTVYVGSPNSGIWKTTTHGNSWQCISDDLANIGVSDIYIDPEDSKKILILTGDPYGNVNSSIGVLKTENGGDTWESTGLSHDSFQFVNQFKMEVLPTKKNIILVAGNRGIFRSIDKGNTWENVNDELPFSDLAVHPTNDNIIYASPFTNSEDVLSFYKSTDAGLTWSIKNIIIPEDIEAVSRTVIGVSVAQPDYVYVLGTKQSDGSFGGLYRSEDAGESFVLRASTPNIFGSDEFGNEEGGAGRYNLAIAVNPRNAEEVYTSAFHIFKSTNGGSTYKLQNFWSYGSSSLPYVHADNHTLDFYNDILYTGCDGGIFRSEDNGNSWTDMSEGLNITMFYRLGQDPNDENIIVGGTQDNGSNIYRDGQWVHIFGADGMEALVDYEDNDIIYSTFQFGGLIKYSDRGNIIEDFINNGIPESGNWITPYTLHPTDHNTIYAGYVNVWKSEDAGNSWRQISKFNDSPTLVDLQVSTTNPNYLYATTGSKLFVTKNEGKLWVNISEGLPNTSISRIAISQNNPERVWVSIASIGSSEKVFQSINGGQSWEDISNGLPEIPVETIIHQRGTEDQLYIGTDIGIYQKDINMDQWQFYSTGLPGIRINDLEIHYKSGKMRVATFGRGIWEGEILDKPQAEELIVNEIVASNNDLITSNSISFNIDLTGNPTDILWEFEGGTPESSTELNPTITYQAPGLYDVKLTIGGIGNSETIIKSDFINVNEVLSIEENPNLFTIFPNPVNDLLTLSFENPLNKINIEMVNLEGKVMLNELIQLVSEQHLLDLTEFDAGIYFLTVSYENQKLTKRIVISK